jgi:hypothetical protein
MEQTIRSVTERVAIGADILDKAIPGWALRVTQRIIMSCPGKCVLGQVLANGDTYIPGTYSDFIQNHVPSRLGSDAGFDMKGWREKEWDELRDAWVAEIAKRKNT